MHSSSLVDAHHPVRSYVKPTFDPRRLFLSFIFSFVAYSSSISSIYIAFIDKISLVAVTRRVRRGFCRSRVVPRRRNKWTWTGFGLPGLAVYFFGTSHSKILYMIDGYSIRLITITIFFMAINFIAPQRVGFRLESPGKQCSGKRIFSFFISCSFPLSFSRASRDYSNE